MERPWKTAAPCQASVQRRKMAGGAAGGSGSGSSCSTCAWRVADFEPEADEGAEREDGAERAWRPSRPCNASTI
eukprot:4708910-Pyramimonas_sp.AAC.2